MRRFCDGLNRRDGLRAGMAGLFGSSIGLSGLLRAADQSRSKRDVSLIFVFLHGGQSQLDTFDLKPDAPAEFRGEFKPVSTRVPGLQICERLPKMAACADRYSLIRSFRHHNSDHGPADHYMLTGYFPAAGFNPSLSPNNTRPSAGAVVSRMLGGAGAVPAYVALPKMHPSGGSAFLGANPRPLSTSPLSRPSFPDPRRTDTAFARWSMASCRATCSAPSNAGFSPGPWCFNP
jgi:hypothetical protein